MQSTIRALCTERPSMSQDQQPARIADAAQIGDDSSQLPEQFLAMRRKNKRKKIIKRAAIGVVAVVAVVGVVHAVAGNGEQSGEQPTVQTYTQAVEKGTLDLSV